MVGIATVTSGNPMISPALQIEQLRLVDAAVTAREMTTNVIMTATRMVSFMTFLDGGGALEQIMTNDAFYKKIFLYIQWCHSESTVVIDD
jgi:hypothetical protein